MSINKKVNFALLPKTVDYLDELSIAMFRPKSDVIDYLVAAEIERRNNPSPALVTIITDGKEQVVHAMVTRDAETGKITVVPSN
ncbi:MAG TPA: hypothetical protein DDW19_01390 [Anaerolineaceae bacterium]|nr:hypothetical protein [Anaerolineaceae bacterium]